MSDEFCDWYPCSTMADVCKAQETGHEIEMRPSKRWVWDKWSGETWNINWQYRASPPQPKKVKMLGWRDKITGALYLCREGVMTNSFCIRYPKLDDEVEE